MFDFSRFQLWHSIIVLMLVLLALAFLLPVTDENTQSKTVVDTAQTPSAQISSKTIDLPPPTFRSTLEADLLDETLPDPTKNLDVSQPVQTLSIALIYEGSEGNQDHAFVDMAIAGAQQARDDLRADFIQRPIKTEADREAALRELSQKGTKLIISLGYQNVNIVSQLANEFPQTRFVVIDGMLPPLYTNVQSILFKDHEGAFLVGMIAAYTTKTQTVGFIGGVDVPLIRNFFVGFEQGVHFVDKNIRIVARSVGKPDDKISPWNNPSEAEKLANELYDDEVVDVIFAAAGGSSIGVLKAAHAHKKLAIGVDTNQNSIYPGSVLSSMVKRVDKAVYGAIRDAKEGHWEAGIKYLGVKDDALDYAIDANNKALVSEKVIAEVELAKDKIIRGVKVIEAYQP